ncbi:MAG TPA: ABC transporter ATP-binding protein, partial [Sorangium sp.]|nr:ABC transporter ATP-binding protein [Sorangium sp.]
MTTPTPVLDVRQLRVSFDTERGSITAVDGISFAIAAGTTVALVGESGCGKTVTAMAIMRLLHRPPAHVSGEIALAGSNLLTLSPRDMRNVRGGRIGMVFQDPNAALNPVYRVGSQLVEAYRMHRSISRPQARRLGIALLQRVGLPEAERHFDHYPHQLSGGMR